MKKAFAISVSLLVCMLIAFACKKSSTTTATTTTTTTTSSAPTNTTSTNFTVDGTAASSPTVSVNNNTGNYVVTGIDGSHLYPQIELVFPGTSSPTSGVYGITNTNGAAPTAGHCELFLITASGSYPASSGNVTVATATTNSVTSTSAYFSNINCTYSGATHTVTGNIKWP